MEDLPKAGSTVCTSQHRAPGWWQLMSWETVRAPWPSSLPGVWGLGFNIFQVRKYLQKVKFPSMKRRFVHLIAFALPLNASYCKEKKHGEVLWAGWQWSWGPARRSGEEWGYLGWVFLTLKNPSSPSVFCPGSGEDGRGAAVLMLQSNEALIWWDTEAPQEHGHRQNVPRWLGLINDVQHI